MKYAVAIAAVPLLLAGCGTAGNIASPTTSPSDGIPRISPISISAPPSMSAPASPAGCHDAPSRTVDIINGGFTNGEHLEDTASIDGPSASVIIGGNITSAAGERESSHEAWLYADGQVYALTKNARRHSMFSDGRDLVGANWVDYFSQLSDCITAATRGG